MAMGVMHEQSVVTIPQVCSLHSNLDWVTPGRFNSPSVEKGIILEGK